MLSYYLKLALLNLKRNPVLSILIIFAISLGIGLSMTSLNIYYLMSADPIPNKSDQLFAVQLDSYGKGIEYQYSNDGLQYQITYQDAMNLSESEIPFRQSRMLRSGAAVKSELNEVIPFMEAIRFCDHGFFGMFDFEFIEGNVWDESIDQNAKFLAVITESMREKVFGNNRALGEKLELGGNFYTVVGVVKDYRPTPFFYDLNTNHYRSSEKIFLPFSLIPKIEARGWGNYTAWKSEDFKNHQDFLQGEGFWIQYWLELKGEIHKQQYEDYIAHYISQQKNIGRFEKDDARGKIRNVKEWLAYNNVVSEDNRILVGLGFLFLFACIINAIGLLLAKLLRNAPEAGIRRALGASKMDLFAQYGFEIIITGILGGFFGLLLTYVGLQGLRSIFSAYDELTKLNLSMVFYIFSISLLSSLAAGLLPIFRICQTQPSIYLKSQ